ncbi:DNA methyltransferase [Amycolatopsis mediterranei]|uniref:DNA methyltransferase n=1 Tax=Amycolatopsis mediterranei TaxID=33910 RepID=UPI002E15567A
MTRDFPCSIETVGRASAALRRILCPTGVAWLIVDAHKASDLCWRVAFALQEDGWLLRNALIVEQVPETASYETVFLFARTTRYYFDLDAIGTTTRKNPGDVWPAQDVLEKCIAAGCPHEGVVADPFGWSADVGAAARRVGRHYVELRPQRSAA